MKKSIAGIAVCALLVVLAAIAVVTSGAPAAVPASAPAEEFSSERAFEHLKAIAAAPHPLGSAEHDRVRDYIVGALEKAGLEVQVQSATGVVTRYDAAGSVQNIVARLKGSLRPSSGPAGSGKAVAIAAHYDSVAAAPGAGDDGAAVAAMLETLRALKAAGPLKNDVILLFTDGEENGLLGAAAFMAEHPWAKEIGVLLNFEGRGISGASLMFETSAGNAWLVESFAQTRHPRGSSLAYEIYKRLPNDTDFTVFKKHGIPGLNFAFVDGWYAYHTPHDSPPRLATDSLQHHGSYMLALARELGNADLAQKHEGDAVYFNLLGDALVRYSTGLGMALALAASGLYGFVLRRELQQKRTMLLGVIWGAGILVLSAVLTGLLGMAVRWKAGFLHGWLLPDGDVLRSGTYMLSLVLFAVGINAGMYSLWRNKLGAAGLALGGLAVWTLLALWSAFAVPGASYLLTWPLLGSLVAVAMFRSTGEEECVGMKEIAALVVGALPCVLLFAPTVQQLFVTLGLSQLGTHAMCVFLTLALWALIPQIELMTRRQRWLLPAAAYGLGIVLFIGAMITTRYSDEHPEVKMVFYGLNADTGKAAWFSVGDAADEWTAQYVSESPSREPLPEFFPDAPGSRFLKSEAPRVALAGPEVLLGEEKKEGETRTLTLLVTSPRQARSLNVYVAEPEVLAASVNGKPLEKEPGARRQPARGWRLRFANPPKPGIELTLTVKSGQPVKLRVVDASPGLPEIPGKSFQPRPARMMPIGSGDITLASQGYVF